MHLNISLSYNIENKIYLKQGVRSPGEKPRKKWQAKFSFLFLVSNQEQPHRKRQAVAEISTRCIISSLERLRFAHQLSLQATVDVVFMNLKFYGNIIGTVVFQIVCYVHLVLTDLFHEWFLILHTGTFGCTVREGNANAQIMAMHCGRNERAQIQKATETFKVHAAQRLMEEWRYWDPEMETMRLEEVPKMVAVFYKGCWSSKL